MTEQIYNEFTEFGVNINEETVQKLFQYYALLKEENSKYNITSVTKFEDVLIKHFIDSASIVKFFPELMNASVIDVGTGGGFPGLVIALICPNARVTLLDSISKKTDFLKLVVSSINLSNVEILTGRAEEYGTQERYRESYDVVVSRAVARLNLLLEYLFPFVKVGGRMVCYKGSNIEDECKEAKKALGMLGGSDFRTDNYSLPDDAGNRVFISATKERNTPSSYPRRTGVPAKRPII